MTVLIKNSLATSYSRTNNSIIREIRYCDFARILPSCLDLKIEIFLNICSLQVNADKFPQNCRTNYM